MSTWGWIFFGLHVLGVIFFSGLGVWSFYHRMWKYTVFFALFTLVEVIAVISDVS